VIVVGSIFPAVAFNMTEESSFSEIVYEETLKKI